MTIEQSVARQFKLLVLLAIVVLYAIFGYFPIKGILIGGVHNHNITTDNYALVIQTKGVNRQYNVSDVTFQGMMDVNASRTVMLWCTHWNRCILPVSKMP